MNYITVYVQFNLMSQNRLVIQHIDAAVVSNISYLKLYHLQPTIPVQSEAMHDSILANLVGHNYVLQSKNKNIKFVNFLLENSHARTILTICL